ncbi:MAG: M23 family metallopeptidase [Clostridia bacterium]|nr:M23 family metallopeptidase [Clostridia bacterium]
MKKAYVKVKASGAKSGVKRPYIAATIIGASVFAVALSFLAPQPSIEQNVEESVISVPSAVPQVTETPKKEPTKELPQQPKEIEMPVQTEVVNPNQETSQPEVLQAEDESVSVGLFQGAEALALVPPVAGEILKGYSVDKPVKSETLGDWRIHTGIDIKAEKGTKVVAPADGKIIVAAHNALTGHTISIEHADGVISTIYNLEGSDTVTEGQTVHSGDVIGTVGDSAAIEGLEEPHIHFEVTVHDAFVNPTDYFS